MIYKKERKFFTLLKLLGCAVQEWFMLFCLKIVPLGMAKCVKPVKWKVIVRGRCDVEAFSYLSSSSTDILPIWGARIESESYQYHAFFECTCLMFLLMTLRANYFIISQIMPYYTWWCGQSDKKMYDFEDCLTRSTSILCVQSILHVVLSSTCIKSCFWLVTDITSTLFDKSPLILTPKHSYAGHKSSGLVSV